MIPIHVRNSHWIALVRWVQNGQTYFYMLMILITAIQRRESKKHFNPQRMTLSTPQTHSGYTVTQLHTYHIPMSAVHAQC
jgi:hypothetical protein